jgi:alkylhydroperoxidase family enzyme
VKLTREPWGVTEADIQRLRGLGLKDEDILDAVSVIGLFNHVDRVADALGISVNPGYYEMQVKPGVV